jgi:hypothetical protein
MWVGFKTEIRCLRDATKISLGCLLDVTYVSLRCLKCVVKMTKSDKFGTTFSTNFMIKIGVLKTSLE